MPTITKLQASEKLKKGEYSYVPLNKIFSPKIKAREWVNPERVKEIAESAIAHGILQPILVSPIPSKPGCYYLVYGQHRIAAINYIKENDLDVIYKDHFPLDAIKAEIRHLTCAERLEIALLENKNREDQNPIDLIIGILNLIMMELTDIMQSDGLDCECDRAYAKAIIERLHWIDQPNAKQGSFAPNRLSPYTQIPITRYNSGIPAIDLEATRAILDRFNMTPTTATTAYLPLLLMCPDVIKAVQMGHVAYPKGRVINQVLDDRYRNFLLDLTHKTNMRRDGLYKMVKIPTEKQKAFIEEVESKELTNKEIEAIAEGYLPNNQQNVMKKAWKSVVSKINNNNTIWDDSKKVKKLQKLVQEILELID